MAKRPISPEKPGTETLTPLKPAGSPVPPPPRFAGTVEMEAACRLLSAEHHDPFGVLGPHRIQTKDGDRLAIRVLAPGAESVQLFAADGSPPVTAPRVLDEGFFELITDAPPGGGTGRWRLYRVRVAMPGGSTWEVIDPYQFSGILGELDLHLFAEGNHFRNFERIGAHLTECDGVKGVHFSVWAPNAQRVSVVGDFNGWDGRRHPMRNLGASGLWEIFIPGLCAGDIYKFEVRSAHGGFVALRSDPYALRCEMRPRTGSIVHVIDGYAWGDSAWMASRNKRHALDAPLAIYEVHLGSWMRGEGNTFLDYRGLAHRLADYRRDMGFTHIELLPILEHPFDDSWGYQPLGYFAPTSRYGSPEDFQYFVDHLHKNEIGVILDWVPAHFPRDEHGLRFFDGSHLYEHSDPREGEHRDWGTMIFNYGRHEVRNFLLGNALFWLEKYHLDGLRVDAVASMLYRDYSRREGEWIPNEFGGRENLEAISFLKRLNELCHAQHPGILTFAEESTAWPGVSRPTYLGGLGFSMKWNMGWMNDVLLYFSKDPVHRKYHHDNLTFSLLYAFSENFVLPLSHDEVVHGKGSLLDKMPGDTWQKFASLRSLLAFQAAHPGKKLLFMGQEFGQGREWSCRQSIDWHLLETDWHAGVQRMMRDLLHLYQSERSLHQVDFEWQGFEWVDCHDWEKSIVSFVRKARDPRDWVLVVCNFTPVARKGYRVGVHESGLYRELFNSDSQFYRGSNQGNGAGARSNPGPVQGRAHSIELTLPPSGVVILKRVGD